MSAKNMDSQGRWRNKTVAFRVSPEEDELKRWSDYPVLRSRNTLSGACRKKKLS